MLQYAVYTLTVHFNRKTCALAKLCSYTLSQSCDTGTGQKLQLHVYVKMWEIENGENVDLCDLVGQILITMTVAWLLVSL